jgi:acyl-CoA thioester hydrolase
MSDDLYRFSTTLEVRWRDVDALNHVNNAVYFTYLEQARVHYLHELGFALDKPTDVGIIIAEATCRFRSPLRLKEKVTIRARASELRRRSFVLEYRIEGGDGRLAATASTVQVCFDYDEERPISIPDRWREVLIAYEPGL